jgi:hypothetical protein
MKAYWWSGGIAPLILWPPVLNGSEWSASRPGRFIPRERVPGSHWLGGWVGPRAVLDAVVMRKITSPHRESNPKTPIVQPLAQRYTDWAITALTRKNTWSNNRISLIICYPFPRDLAHTLSDTTWRIQPMGTRSSVRKSATPTVPWPEVTA